MKANGPEDRPIDKLAFSRSSRAFTRQSAQSGMQRPANAGDLTSLHLPDFPVGTDAFLSVHPRYYLGRLAYHATNAFAIQPMMMRGQ